MVSTQYRCKNERRRNEVRKRKDADGLPILNGIDYLEVATDQKTLFVHFIHILEQNTLTIENIQVRRFEGTTAIEVPIESVSASSRLLTIGVTAPKDVFTYTMQLVEAFGKEKPPTGFDSQLAQVEFLFQVADLSEFDCKTPTEPTEKPPLPPVIDYLAKDYASFRQLMLDRLAVTMPQWQERSPADLGIMLVELVAYKADYLSYFQDAVATESYLGTARKRVSVRRHARLLNYPMHDGCNARTWVTLRVNQPLTLPDRNTAKTRFLTNVPGLPSILSEKEFDIAINRGAQVFEAMEDAKLDPACNEIHFYTWSDLTCVLPTGAIAATLKDEGKLAQLLQPGTVLIIEEVKGAQSGEPADADLTHRHAVRLTKVMLDRDPLEDVSLVEIEWSQEDALPFPITISQIVGDRPISDISIVRGNVILVDHGYTVDGSENRMLDWVSAKRYRARLRERPLTQQGRVQVSTNTQQQDSAAAAFVKAFGKDWSEGWGSKPTFNPSASAASVWKWEMRDVMPAIFLEEQDASTNEINFWYPQRDLLNSDRFAREFVVEMEDDGRAYLRFGDGQVGRQPQADATLSAIYRIGNGTQGNVGAEAIAHLFCKAWDSQEVLLTIGNTNPIRNPLPARGGVDPEPIEQVRLYAPQAFRTLQRAVTEADYAKIVQRFPGVSKALATRRWTGSWYTIFITVDRQNGLLIDETFKQELTSFLEQFRLTGQDVEIESPSFIPLDIALKVQVAPDYFQSQVKEALLNAFSNKVLGEGRLGFFHPDNFSFGQPVYLSKVITQAMQVVGVQSVTAKRFKRWGLPPQNELELGRIALGRLEIARLDNDANMPGQGRLELLLEGGL